MRRVAVVLGVVVLLMQGGAHADSDAFLGVYLGKVSEQLAKKMGGDGRGVYVEGIIEGTAAEKAGMQDHDVIVELDGDRIAGPAHLGEVLEFYSPGDRITVKVWRKGKTLTLPVELGERTKVKLGGTVALVKGAPKAWFGVTVQNLTDQLAEYFGTTEGVLISSVAEDSPADRAGVRAGDVLTMVDSEHIEEPADLPVLIAEREPGENVTAHLIRKGQQLALRAVLAETPPEKRGQAQVYLWGGEEGLEGLEGIEGLEGLEGLKALEILGIPGLIIQSKELDEMREKLEAQESAGLEEERRGLEEERKALEAERETLRTEMEELRIQLEELKTALEESK
jgi:membrane-associated protease RseP (regulator of RpoE activity)